MATRLKTPADISGLVGYHSVAVPSTFDLDTNSGAIQWRAKYGSTVLNQTDSGRRPAYSSSIASINNKPGFTFVTGTRMDFADASMFPADTAGHTIILLYRATVSKTNAIVLSWGSATGKWRIAGFGHSGQNAWAANSIGDHDSTLNVLNNTSVTTHTLSSGANPVSTHFLNGSAGQSKTFNGSVSQGSTAAAIGYTSFYTAFDANGIILEAVLVYNRELSASERQDAEAIVAWDHGQQSILAGSTSPYQNAAPTIDDGGATTGGTGTASGTGTATATGAAAAGGTGSAAGAGTASGIGSSRVAGAGTATGSGTASGTGAALASGTGSAAGTGVATATTTAQFGGTGTAAGAGTATAIGSTVAAGTGTASGSSSATGTSGSQNVIGAIGTASGGSVVLGIGSARAGGTGSAAGTSSAASSSGQTVGGLGTATGTGTATATSAVRIGGLGVAFGFSSVSAGGGSRIGGLGVAVGIGHAFAYGARLQILARPPPSRTARTIVKYRVAVDPVRGNRAH